MKGELQMLSSIRIILDDLILYHRNEGLHDFSFLEVNRYVMLTICIIIKFTQTHGHGR